MAHKTEPTALESQEPSVDTQEKPQQEVVIHLPNRWAIEIYEEYFDGKQKYVDKCAEDERSASETLARYHGALALIHKQSVIVEGLEILEAAIANQKTTDMAVVGYLVKTIANPCEASVNGPLLGWTSK